MPEKMAVLFLVCTVLVWFALITFDANINEFAGDVQH